jgi:hypothetical protein
MTKIVKLTESDLTKIVKMVMEQTILRDKWGRPSLEKGKPSTNYIKTDSAEKNSIVQYNFLNDILCRLYPLN